MSVERETADKAKKVWESPTLTEIDISETANGMIGNDGQGGGSNQGGNSSGS